MSDPSLPPDNPPPVEPAAPSAEPVAAPEAAPPPAGNVRSWLVAGGVAAIVALGAGYLLGRGGDDGTTVDTEGAAASADQQAGGDELVRGPGGALPGMGTAGEITSIDGDTLTVESDDGSTTTVSTSDDTVVRESAEGSADDLAEGDHVLVTGEADDDGGITAEAVVDNGDAELTIAGGPDGAGPPNVDGEAPEGLPAPPDGAELPDGAEMTRGFPTAGELTSIDGDTLTVETADGETVTVTLTDDTTVTVNQDLEVDDLEEGDEVRVMGEASDDVVEARVIQVGDLATFGGPMGGPPGGGVVVGGDTAGA
jgi:preprotein translocase subunit YajC